MVVGIHSSGLTATPAGMAERAARANFRKCPRCSFNKSRNASGVRFFAMLAGALSGGFGLALAAGAVALWATFVPCFLWIFLAAPYLDRLAARPRLSAALHGSTAAVVGVILNLSVWFALNVLFESVPHISWGPLAIPVPQLSQLDFTALGLTILAGVLIFRVKLGMGMVLALMSIAGLAAHNI